MDSFKTYKTIMAPRALQLLDGILAYIVNEYHTMDTALSVYQDAVETREKLSFTAGSFRLLRDSELAALGYRKINFTHHDYLMIYRVQGDTAYIVAVYHQSEDYENHFAKEIGIRD